MMPNPTVEALSDTDRVPGDLAEHPGRVAPSHQPETNRPSLWADKGWRNRIGTAPDERVLKWLRPALDDIVDTSKNRETARLTRELFGDLAASPPGKRCGMLSQIGPHKAALAHARQTAKLIGVLTE